MLTARAFALARQSGFTLLEVLITMIILAFGLLALANLQTKMHLTEMESYQRAQAVLLVEDMVSKINNNRGAAGLNAVNYVTGTANALGTGDATSCASPVTAVDKDKCAWSNELKGAAETKTSGGNTTSVGAMIGARGCIEQVQAPVAATCTPGIYRVTVAWQGMAPTAVPALLCGKDQYDQEAKRRAIANQIAIGMPGCTS